MLPPLLTNHMLDNRLLARFPHETADEAGIPQLTRDAQVLTAAHQGVGFASLRRGWDAVRVEVLLFAARYAHESGWKVSYLPCPALGSEREQSRGRLALSLVHRSQALINLPPMTNQPILPRDYFSCDDCLPPRR